MINELLNQIEPIIQQIEVIIRQNQDLIIWVFMIAVLLFLLSNIFVIAVNAIGFTAGGVLYGKCLLLTDLYTIYTRSLA